MITLKNVKTPGGAVTDLTVNSPSAQIIDAKSQLVLLPSIIDTDTNLSAITSRTTIDWHAQAHNILKSGITSVFYSEGIPPKSAQEKIKQINNLLTTPNTPLRIHFFCDGNDPDNFHDIGKAKSLFKGIKTSVNLAETQIGSPYSSALARLFQIAAQEDLIVIIALVPGKKGADEQKKTALAAVDLSINLAEKYNAQLCLQHIRTREELKHIEDAKKSGLLVFTEIAYPHLFITEDRIASVNNNSSEPFLPSPVDRDALWEALNNGDIDLVGSGESRFSPPEDPSFAARLLLPCLLNAVNEKKIRIETVISVIRVNAEKIFRLRPNDDIILADLTVSRPLNIPASHEVAHPPAWEKLTLTGWPSHVITQGSLFSNI